MEDYITRKNKQHPQEWVNRIVFSGTSRLGRSLAKQVNRLCVIALKIAPIQESI